MIKFNDEELSRILSAHAGGQLLRWGTHWDAGGRYACIVQAAKLIPSGMDAMNKDREMTRWFDLEYEYDWSATRLLREIEKRGRA